MLVNFLFRLHRQCQNKKVVNLIEKSQRGMIILPKKQTKSLKQLGNRNRLLGIQTVQPLSQQTQFAFNFSTDDKKAAAAKKALDKALREAELKKQRELDEKDDPYAEDEWKEEKYNEQDYQ